MSDKKIEDYEPIKLAALNNRELISKIRSLITTIESLEARIVIKDQALEGARDMFNQYVAKRNEHSESQKEEIERLKECEMELVLAERVILQKKEMLKDVENRMSEVIDSRDKLQDQIESLKAITELAVNGLKEISIHKVHSYASSYQLIRQANSILSKIERLQNEKP